VAFVVAATVGSLKLTDIVNVQWGDIISVAALVLFSFKDWLIGKLPLAGLLGIVSLGSILQTLLSRSDNSVWKVSIRVLVNTPV